MTLEPLDLTNCDREPIHIPGSIQPHGVLLVLEPKTLKVLQVSQNVLDLTGHTPQTWLGTALSDWLVPSQIEAIRQCLNEDFDSINPLELSLETPGETRWFDGIVHGCAGGVIIELEPRRAPEKTGFLDFYQKVRGTITKIQKATTLHQMSQIVVQEVRKITGFDRVMVYRFDEEGTGSVIAEDTNQGVSYLNLRYPATDIPRQARHLYTLNWLRLIPDSTYSPVPLVPPHNPLTGQPTDLSLAVLRSVSPIHLEYLTNMGVTASMSISLVKDQQLWGLIACHHLSPKSIPYDLRTVCEFIGQVMSLELANKEANEDLDYKMRLRASHTRFVELLSQSHYFWEGVVQLEANLLELVSATGAVICSDTHCIQVGETPTEAEIHALIQWLKPHLHHNLFHTDSLPRLYPAAAAYGAIASGVLALEISKVHHNYILWFRPEVIQTVNWGGNPNKPVEVLEDGSQRMSPRKSFELWQEQVRGRSLPWKPCEIEAVAELRSMIVGLVLRQADELASMNQELQRSNEELDSFAYIASHDLKEPLRGIHNYANFLMEDYGETLHEDGMAKLQTLVRLTQRMENLINSLLHFSRMGRTELVRQPVNMHELVQQAIATIRISRPQDAIEFRVSQALPVVECDRAQVSEVFVNLISNAIKYNNQSEKQVEVGVVTRDPPAESVPIFYVRDNGIGIPKEHHERIFQIFRRLHGRDDYGGGNGAGLTIARKIVERHGGRIWLESAPNQGSTFYFTLTDTSY